VRIEDDVLVEKDGATVLSKDIPRDIDAVEGIVGRKK
jgi:Xaa-Pro aminopeptidase